MEKTDILKKVDHTILDQKAGWEEVKKICTEGMKYHTASVCIPPAYVKKAKDYVKDNIKICTVIGFPNGYQTTAVKVFETMEAIKNGADEIDMVIFLGWVKDRKYECIEQEIKQVKRECKNHILKVIVETCLLSQEEKIQLCRTVTAAGADYIKTSTGFSTAGASIEDIKLFRRHIGEDIKIKASGGISSFDEAALFLEAGADRLGTSRLVKLISADGWERKMQ